MNAKKRLTFLIGTQVGLDLENRLFNSISLIAIFILLCNIPFNYFSGLQVTALIFGILTVFLGYMYYLARFKNRLIVSVTISCSLVIILFAINYFFSAGIRGASLLSFTLAFILIVIVSPKKLYGFWVSFCLFIVVGLLVAEYHYPNAIKVAYVDEKSLFIDIAFTYATGIAVSFFSLFYLKEAYYKEKRSAENRAIELVRSNDEKLKLFSIISHDLQAPLSSLHSYIRLVADDRLMPDERKHVERGLANALHVTQEMLSNMLIWSQGQLRGLRVELMPHNIKSVLYPIVDIQRVYADQKGISMETDFDESLTVSVDRDMLQLIIRNLINNAIKFTPPGGHIRVSARAAGTNCQIVVEDNGIGIPEAQQAELFSLKTRSTYGTNNERGIGLGLFLCSEYTLAQNGVISFDSEPGNGTRFRLLLPLVS
ncbi:sensor histidine kinase [Parapedobacter sp. DT-150]|uniref:sensor histidine kinase n=1 Tax=Parapedobacter sp. DT-150 TaxID=3396162 RepID=UPI003F53F172